jgi:hypothetical protein
LSLSASIASNARDLDIPSYLATIHPATHGPASRLIRARVWCGACGVLPRGCTTCRKCGTRWAAPRAAGRRAIYGNPACATCEAYHLTWRPDTARGTSASPTDQCLLPRCSRCTRARVRAREAQTSPCTAPASCAPGARCVALEAGRAVGGEAVLVVTVSS